MVAPTPKVSSSGWAKIASRPPLGMRILLPCMTAASRPRTIECSEGTLEAGGLMLDSASSLQRLASSFQPPIVLHRPYDDRHASVRREDRRRGVALAGAGDLPQRGRGGWRGAAAGGGAGCRRG